MVRVASLAISGALLGALGGLVLVSSMIHAAGPSRDDTTLVFGRGMGVAAIAESLEDAGVVKRAGTFAAWVRLSGRAGALRAGEYEFPAGATVAEVARMMVDGRTRKRWFTAVEGRTAAQILAQLVAAEGLVGTVPAGVPEGTLLPETYRYEWGDTRAALVDRMQRAMDSTLAEVWADRAPGLPLATPGDLAILASIVEREAGRADERARIAGVFVNRLRIGMRLQSDATVAYGLGRVVNAQAPLTRADLRMNHPHNTYVHAGLPPSPIANPGRAALEASAHPAQSPDLFFVQDGAGGHAFAETLQEHNRNAARFRALQRR